MSKVHFPNLDALRFLAFLSVFLYHSFWTNNPSVLNNGFYHYTYAATRIGHLGVNFFFVLSGFLISYLLFNERKQTGQISLKDFYLRRILRIWPLFYLITVSLILIVPLIYQLIHGSFLDVNVTKWKFFLFLSNFDYIQSDSVFPTLNTLWSISIEEQFYLIWPVLFIFFTGKRFIYPIVIIIIATFIFRYLNSSDIRVLQWHTFSVINDMAVGGLLAYIAFYHESFVQKLAQNIPKTFIILFYGLLLASAYYFENSTINSLATASSRIVLSLFFAFIIFEQVYSPNSFFKLGKFTLFTRLGKITYGLYCYHYLCLYAALKIGQLVGWNKQLFGVLFLDNIVGLSISIVIATLSYKYFEQHFLLIKNRFQKKSMQAQPL